MDSRNDKYDNENIYISFIDRTHFIIAGTLLLAGLAAVVVIFLQFLFYSK